ncbi:MAG TPA: NAD-dependent epimerase/dehydratase family protein [Halanaerobiales bacterium]|nr:NAD-dependent epimerase/dehydratase family protein [Halanaerobiales bacterium]
MRVMVTGGAGFIGSSIVDKLLDKGYEIIVVDNLSTGKEENLNPGAEFYKLDINSPELYEIFEKREIDYLIHHAAQIDVNRSVEAPLFDAGNNIMASINLFEACCQHGVKKIIYASSAAVYGDPDYLPVDEKHPLRPMSPYGISKHTPEHYLKIYSDIYGIEYTVFRYSNAYGPRQDPLGEGGVISIFIDQMLADKKPIIYGDGENTRDFIHIYDIVEANIRALKQGANEILNISCNTQNSINELYGIINKILGTEITAIYEDQRKGDISHSCLDNSRAREVLGWAPEYDLYSGLVQTISHYARKRGIEDIVELLED